MHPPKLPEAVIMVNAGRAGDPPIQKLPVEILTNVLLLSLWMEHRRIVPDESVRRLCRVCSLWRDAILQCQQFWTTIHNFSPPHTFLPTKLRRSGNASLKIICFNPDTPFVESILPHLHRCEYIHTRTTEANIARILGQSIPRLKILKLKVPESTYWVGPFPPALVFDPPKNLAGVRRIKLKGITFFTGVSGTRLTLSRS